MTGELRVLRHTAAEQQAVQLLEVIEEREAELVKVRAALTALWEASGRPTNARRMPAFPAIAWARSLRPQARP